MDLDFAPEDLRFRDEVMAFLRDAVPPSIQKKLLACHKLDRAELAAWHATLDAKGWVAPHWPQEWGGTGWSATRQFLFRECLHLAPAPEPHVQNINLIGPIIAAFGSEQMKARFLPAIRRLDMLFCQGFSEPGAGSDLASLRTRAERDGDDYIVNGQKTWTTSAHMADWMFCLVRTDPDAKKHEGISYLLIPMDSPGITVRPIRTLDGQHHLNEVFLDNVRVPATQLVGEENQGWSYSRFLLAQERLTIARLGVSQRNLAVARKRLAGPSACSGTAGHMRRLVELEVQVKALEITNLRMLTASDSGDRQSAHIPSMLKLRGAELQQATSELLVAIGGDAAWTSDDGAAASYLHLRAASIYGGSNEIQKNLIARTLLDA